MYFSFFNENGYCSQMFTFFHPIFFIFAIFEILIYQKNILHHFSISFIYLFFKSLFFFLSDVSVCLSITITMTQFIILFVLYNIYIYQCFFGIFLHIHLEGLELKQRKILIVCVQLYPILASLFRLVVKIATKVRYPLDIHHFFA